MRAMEWGNWLPTIVVVNVLATIVLWRTSSTLWRIAARKPPQPKKSFLNTLKGKPIAPKRVNADALPNYASDSDKQFFRDFADFGDVVNWWLADKYVDSPWRLQELTDTHLSLSGGDYPSFGRAFAVFYNQVRLGRLEVSADGDYCLLGPKVRTEIELHNVRLLSFDTVRGFLFHIALHVSDQDRKKSQEHLQIQHAIEQAMARAVWNTLNHISGFQDLDGQDWGELEVRLEGTAFWYFGRRDCEAFRQLKAAA
jgi:hypothetical protein